MTNNLNKIILVSIKVLVRTPNFIENFYHSDCGINHYLKVVNIK